MHRAIDARPPRVRRDRLVDQPRAAQALPAAAAARRSNASRQELREELILEVGCPRAITHGPQLDAPLDDGLTYPAKLIDDIPVGDSTWATRSYR